MTTQPANQKGVLYLERNRLQMYSLSKPAVLLFDIPATIAHDIEVFNTAELHKTLINFIKTNALPPTDYMLVLAQNVLFEKDFVPANPVEQKKFLDSVPFEIVSTKEFPITGGIRVVAANSDFYSSVVDILQENGSHVEAVIPYFSVSPQMSGIDQNVVALVLNQFNQLKRSSLMPTQGPELVITNPEADRKAEAKKKDNKTLIYSIPLFALLIGVLGFMLLRPAGKPVTSNTQAATPRPSLPILLPTPTAPVASASASPVTLGKDKTTIQINYDTSLAQQAKTLQDRLVQAGYTSTQLHDAGVVNSPKPLLLYSAILSQDLKNDLFNVIRNAMPEVVTQEDDSISFNVIITIGK